MSASAGSGNAGPSRKSSSIVVRPATAGDAVDAARLHARHIPTGFLSVLGPRLLTRLYRRVARSDDCFLLMAETNGQTVGFLAGSLDTGRLMRRFALLDGPVVAVAAAPALLRHWRHVLETMSDLRPGKAMAEPATDPAPAAVEAELLALAVDEERRGSGVGAMLTRAFVEEAIRRGAGTARVVVGAANDPAVALYERYGFVAAEHFEHHRGTPSLLMRRPLSADRSAEHPSGPAVSR